jgi:hypothetical protein
MRYFVGFLITVGLIIFVIILLFRGGGPVKEPLFLPDYAGTTAIARYVIDTEISSPQTHRSVEITVGNQTSTLSVLKGYDGDIERTKSYDMTDTAYDVFLHALQVSGFTQGNDNPEFRDERGQCPLGNRYIYEMVNDDERLMRFWSTSCNTGTFKGEADAVRELFEKQIPDFDDLTDGLNL